MKQKIQHVSNHNARWFRTTFQLRGSVVTKVMPRVIVIGLIAAIINYLFTRGYNVALPILAGIIPNIVIGLLLVFRTNTAYERFWEGRKLWGSITNISRNLAREILVNIQVSTKTDINEKKDVLRLISAFGVAMKQQLRGDSTEILSQYMSSKTFGQLQSSQTPALDIATHISRYLNKHLKLGTIDSIQCAQIESLINSLVDSLGGCERILKTPIPLAYSIHLKQLLMIYTVTLPFQFVGVLNWWSVPIVMLVSFTLFGIEEIGAEIENPFGKDPNDLPLDSITQGIDDYITSLHV